MFDVPRGGEGLSCSLGFKGAIYTVPKEELEMLAAFHIRKKIQKNKKNTLVSNGGLTSEPEELPSWEGKRPTYPEGGKERNWIHCGGHQWGPSLDEPIRDGADRGWKRVRNARAQWAGGRNRKRVPASTG